MNGFRSLKTPGFKQVSLLSTLYKIIILHYLHRRSNVWWGSCTLYCAKRCWWFTTSTSGYHNSRCWFTSSVAFISQIINIVEVHSQCSISAVVKNNSWLLYSLQNELEITTRRQHLERKSVSVWMELDIIMNQLSILRDTSDVDCNCRLCA